MATKAEIRKEMLALRRRMPELLRLQKSGIICKKLTTLPEYQRSEIIYTYVSLPHEVSTFPLIDAAWKDGKKVAVPRVDGEEMHFVLLNSYEQLEEGTFHVLEPKYGAIVEKKQALLVMPGLAFDRCRHRIGYGKGFYDRFLQREGEHLTVAFSFHSAVLEEIPSTAQDIKPRLILTEKEAIGTLTEDGK